LDPDGVDLFRCFTEDVHAFVEGFCEEEGIITVEPEDIITFKRVMILPEQVPEHGKTYINPEAIKTRDYRGQRWTLPYKAELQALTLERRLEVMREAIDAEVDHGQLQLDREESRKEREEVLSGVELATNGQKTEEEEEGTVPSAAIDAVVGAAETEAYRLLGRVEEYQGTKLTHGQRRSLQEEMYRRASIRLKDL